MKLEDQVCSLELAKRLKELGVEQESLFYWSDSFGLVLATTEIREESHSAFTVAELGEMLPPLRHDGDANSFWVQSHKNDDSTWTVKYSQVKDDVQIVQPDKSEADARAKMLIYLIEKGLVKP